MDDPVKLDYVTPETPQRAPPEWNAAVFIGAFTTVVNAVLYCWAYAERGWGALLIFGSAFPTNVLLILLYLAFIPLVRRKVAAGDSIRVYVLVGILAPVAALALFTCGMHAIPRDQHAAP